MSNKKNDTQRIDYKKFDLGILLIVGAAAFQSYQFGRALNVYDPEGWALYGVNIGGLILGAIVNVIVVLAATRLPQLTAAALKVSDKSESKKTKIRNDRKSQKAAVQARFAQVSFFGLLILSPFLVSPAMYILWVKLPLPPLLVGVLCVGWAVAPDLTIALGGFVTGKSLVQLGDAPSAKSTKSATDLSEKSVAHAKKSDGGATDFGLSASDSSDSLALRRTYPRTCEHCATDSPHALIKSPNAVGGHMKKHHPELCKSKENLQFEEIINKATEVAK